MMKKLAIIFLLLMSKNLFSQNVGIGTNTPNPNAIVDVFATDKGILIPRLTAAQRLAIPVVATDEALLVYDTDSNYFFFWNATSWVPIPNQADTDDQTINISGDTLFIEDGNFVILPDDHDWEYNGNHIYNVNPGNVGIGINSPSALLEILGDGSDATTSSLLLLNANADTTMIVRNDGRVGIKTGNPKVELDVMGSQIVGTITPRYLGETTFTIPGTSVVATFDSAAVWSRNAHLYVRFSLTSTITWLQAQEAARVAGGYLPTVTSDAENEFIKNNILGAGNTAIGFTDILKENWFEWVTGEIGIYRQDTIFSDWTPGQPNDDFVCNGGEDAAAYSGVAIDAQRRWYDLNMGSMFPYCTARAIEELVVEFEYVESP